MKLFCLFTPLLFLVGIHALPESQHSRDQVENDDIEQIGTRVLVSTKEATIEGLVQTKGVGWTENVMVKLFRRVDGKKERMGTTRTASDGSYEFIVKGNETEGDFYIQVLKPEGYEFTRSKRCTSNVKTKNGKSGYFQVKLGESIIRDACLQKDRSGEACNREKVGVCDGPCFGRICKNCQCVSLCNEICEQCNDYGELGFFCMLKDPPELGCEGFGISFKPCDGIPGLVCDDQCEICVSDGCAPKADYTPCDDGNNSTFNDLCVHGRCHGSFIDPGPCPECKERDLLKQCVPVRDGTPCGPRLDPKFAFPGTCTSGNCVTVIISETDLPPGVDLLVP